MNDDFDMNCGQTFTLSRSRGSPVKRETRRMTVRSGTSIQEVLNERRERFSSRRKFIHESELAERRKRASELYTNPEEEEEETMKENEQKCFPVAELGAFDSDFERLVEVDYAEQQEANAAEREAEAELEAYLEAEASETATAEETIVVCPICRRGIVSYERDESNSVSIFWCECGFHISINSGPEVDLDFFSDSLQGQILLHSSHCSSDPQFEVRNIGGTSVLLLTCSDCDDSLLVL